MNKLVRERLASSAAAAARSHPAELDQALKRGMLAFRLRLLRIQLAVVAAIVALAGGPLLAATALGPGDFSLSGNPSIDATDVTAIAIEPSRLALAPDERWQLAASGTGSNGEPINVTGSVEWQTADASVAAVDDDGTVSAVNLGTTTILAALGDHRSTATVVVSTTPPALIDFTVAPSPTNVAVGDELRLRASATYDDGTTNDVTGTVTWSEQDAGVARIDDGGVVTGISVGKTTIAARFAGNIALAIIVVDKEVPILETLAITPPEFEVKVQGRKQLTATATYADGSTRDVTLEVDWDTREGAIAQVENGIVTGRAPGTTTVTASSGSERAAATVVVRDDTVVLSRITVTPSSVPIKVGEKATLTATGTYSDGSTRDLPQPVRWTTTGSKVAQVDDTGTATGTVTGTGTGTTTVLARSGDLEGSAIIIVAARAPRLTTIEVTPPSVTGCSNQPFHKQLSAEGTYDNGDVRGISNDVRWNSADAKVAVVDDSGLVTGTGSGSTKIRAVLDAVEGQTSVVLEFCEP